MIVVQTLMLVVLNIILPTLDVLSDLLLIGDLVTEHSKRVHGFVLAIPFLLNYGCGFISEHRSDKGRSTSTFIAALFNLYPQYHAFRVSWLLWYNNEEGLKQKKQIDRGLMEPEIFFEALPTLLILIILEFSVKEDVYSYKWEDLPSGKYSFAVATSMLSVGVGVLKTLILGVCRADAMKCTIVIFVLTILSMYVRSLYTVLSYSWVIHNWQEPELREMYDSLNYNWNAMFYSKTIFIISLFIISIVPLSPWLIITHPSLAAVPLITPFTFRFYRRSKKKLEILADAPANANVVSVSQWSNESFVRFSPGFTLINLAARVTYLGFSMAMTLDMVEEYPVTYVLNYLFKRSLINTLGLLFTCYVLFDDTYGCHLVTWIVYKPSDTNTEYILEGIEKVNPMLELSAMMESNSQIEGVASELFESNEQLEWVSTEPFPQSGVTV